MTAPTVQAEGQLSDQTRMRVGVAIIAGCIVWFYAFVSGVLHDRLSFSPHDNNYYPLLVDGFRAGHLSMAIEPAAGLAKLANPYDPALRQQAGLVDLHDASYYHGRYYLYFGIAPAVTLFLPFRILTGVHFPQGLSTVLFCAGGYFCSLGIFLGLRRRYFPEATTRWVWLGALMLGMGNLCPVMLARNSIWEVAISSAYFYSCLGLLFLFLSEEGGRRSLKLALSGTAFGLSVASRPQFVFLCMVVGLFWLWDLRRRTRAPAPARPGLLARETALLLLPMGLVVAGVLAYNYARFGNPAEFGDSYNLGGIDQSHRQMISARFVLMNLYDYFLAPAQFQRYFPFFSVIRGYPGARPAGYTVVEDPYGILTNLPYSWLAVAAPLLLWRSRRRWPPGVGRWLALFGFGFLAITGLMLCYAGATNRYMVDFLPQLALVAGIGLLFLCREDGQPTARRRWLRAGIAAAIVYSAAFSALAAINHNGIFATNQPEAFAALSRFFNQPALLWERISPETYGPAEITLKFPLDRPGAAEPILVTGISYRSDYLYAVYASDGRHVQLGFSHTNYNQRLSQPIPIDYREPHTIGIQFGSLYPPRSHPFFAGWTPAAVQQAKQTITVTLDGVPYLTGSQDFFDTTPGFVTFGANHVSDFTRARFTGQILGIKRQLLDPAIDPFKGGAFLRLALTLPADPPVGREPLVETGVPGRSDLLFLEYVDPQQVRFGFEHAGSSLEFSPTFTIQPGQIQLVETSLGSFYPHPANARERELAQELVVRLNGQLAWVEAASFHPLGPMAPAVGSNAFGNPTVAAAFTGRVVAESGVKLFPAMADSPFVVAPYWIETGAQPDFGPIRLRLKLPEPFSAPIEPLLVTGPSATQADYISIAYPYAGQIVFGYLHTGGTGPKSRRLRVNSASPLRVEIDMPSLYPPATDEFFAACPIDEITSLKKDWLKLKVDGELAINAPVAYFDSSADEITIGENRVSNVFEYASGLTYRIQSIERGRFTPPPGLAENGGPIEMIFTPSASGRGTECLLASGPEGRSDRLLLTYAGPGRGRFSVQTADGRTLAGSAVALDPASRHTLVIQWGGLYGTGTDRQRVGLSLDGKQILAGRLDFKYEVPQRLAFGGAAAPAAEFSGLIHSVRRLPATAGN